MGLAGISWVPCLERIALKRHLKATWRKTVTSCWQQIDSIWPDWHQQLSSGRAAYCTYNIDSNQVVQQTCYCLVNFGAPFLNSLTRNRCSNFLSHCLFLSYNLKTKDEKTSQRHVIKRDFQSLKLYELCWKHTCHWKQMPFFSCVRGSTLSHILFWGFQWPILSLWWVTGGHLFQQRSLGQLANICQDRLICHRWVMGTRGRVQAQATPDMVSTMDFASIYFLMFKPHTAILECWHHQRDMWHGRGFICL